MTTNDERQSSFDSHSTDRYGDQRKRNRAAQRAYNEAYGSDGARKLDEATRDRAGRSSQSSTPDVSGDEGWDSGNPTEPIGHE